MENNGYLFHKRDELGQKKALPILEKLFNKCTLNIEQHYDDYDLDIYMTATTSNGNVYRYAIECKDRDWKHTDSEDKFRTKGWMLEEHKYTKLREAAEKGYIPLYFNTFKDDTYCIWNTLVCPYDRGNVTANKYTVIPSQTQDKNCYLYHIRESNGIKTFTISGCTS